MLDDAGEAYNLSNVSTSHARDTQTFEAFFNAFPYVRMNEERTYQDRSYFRNKYGSRPEAERDESSLASEELSGMSLVDNDEDMEEEEEDSELEFG